MSHQITKSDKQNLQKLFDYLRPQNIKYRDKSESYRGNDWDILSPDELDEQRAGHCVDKTNYCYLCAEKFGLPKPRVYYSLNVFEHGRMNHTFAVFFGSVLVETANEYKLGIYYCKDLAECFAIETNADRAKDNKRIETVFIEYIPENRHYVSTVDFFNALLKNERPDLLLAKPLKVGG